MNTYHVGQRLRDAAAKRGLSQTEIAERLGKTRSMVSIILGKEDCNVSTLISFIQAIDVGIEEVFPELSKPQPQGLPDYIVRLADLQHEKIVRLEEEVAQYKSTKPN
jgi:transcriptional regulator with XRE-family HTH domain